MVVVPPSPARLFGPDATGVCCCAPLTPPPPPAPCDPLRPQGPWQKWHIRIGFNGREGLVLHNIGWEENGRVRPVIHRASLAEMAVPYGDPK